MRRYLIDTNHLSDAIRLDSRIWPRIRDEADDGHRFAVIVPALGELEAGIRQTADPARNRQELALLLNVVRVWPLEVKYAETFGRLTVELRQAGRILSQTDIWLATVALEMRATLLTTDRDFEALPEVPTENWLV